MSNALRVYMALPMYPLSIGVGNLAKRVGMTVSTCRMAIDVASRHFPICEDDDGKLSRLEK